MMLPEKYLDDLESSGRRQDYLRNLADSAVFLVSLFVIGGVVHELAHTAVLDFYNCSYILDHSLGMSGFRASVQPLCSINNYALSIFYASGYVSTILAGIILLSISFSNLKYSRILAASGTGLLLSVLLSIGRKGDAENFVSTIGLGEIYASFTVLLTVLTVLVLSLKGLQIFLDQNGRNETLNTP